MKINNWNLNLEQLKQFENGFTVDQNSSLRACGCGVKIDLDLIVYPIFQDLENQTELDKFFERRDCFFTLGRFIDLKRQILQADYQRFSLDQYFDNQTKRNLSLIQLYSSSKNFYRDFDKLKSEYKSNQTLYFDNIKRQIPKIPNLKFAKGHSIQGEVDFILTDLIETTNDSTVATLLNNDTIITGDSIIHPDSPLSVFIAISNALNDLFILGGNKNIKIFPIYDGNSNQIDNFKKAFMLYAQHYLKHNISIDIIDKGPLNIGSHLIGATVVAETENIPTKYSQLQTGDSILLTDHLGDLAILAKNRECFKSNIIDKQTADERYEVLSEITTPNYLASIIISKYLPKLNENHDGQKHISFISDISGPGISVLEEAAIASKKDLHINSLLFKNESIFNMFRKNYTTSTNGPWVICGSQKLLLEISQELEKIGIQKNQFIGNIGNSNLAPVTYISKELYSKYSSENFQFNLFYPKSKIKKNNQFEDVTFPLFKNLKIE